MELWVKIGILALCSLWYFSLFQPPSFGNEGELESEAFNARHSFSMTFVVFHFMSWSGLPTLPIVFFVTQGLSWGAVLLVDLYFKYGLFFTGVKLLEPVSDKISFLGIPLLCLVMYTPSAYLAMSLSNIMFRASVLPPYTEVLVDTSALPPVDETDETKEFTLGASGKDESTSKGKPKKKTKSKVDPPLPKEAPEVDPVNPEFYEPTLFLMNMKSSDSISPFDISMERARYATIDTLFLLPFLCAMDVLGQKFSLFSYPSFSVRMFGIPSALLGGYITVSFCAFLLYRHFEATSLPKFTYALESVKEYQFLQVQLVTMSILASVAQIVWVTSLSKDLPSLFPLTVFMTLPVLLTSLRFLFYILDTPDPPIPIDTRELHKPHVE